LAGARARPRLLVDYPLRRRTDDVQSIYRDPLSFSSEQGVQLYFGNASPERAGFRKMMIMLDPPRHPKMRQTVSRRFTPHAVAPNAAMIRRISGAILGGTAIISASAPIWRASRCA
jgi:cytochrome P450